MASPAEHIARLDRSLVRSGEDIVLRRLTGAQNQARSDVTLRAVVRPLSASELVQGSGLTQSHERVILSPSGIARAQWPGGMPPSFVGDPRIPLTGYKAVIRAKERNIDFVKPVRVGGELVRVEILVAG